MSAATDRVAGHPEQGQDRAHHHNDDADRPDDGNLVKPDNMIFLVRNPIILMRNSIMGNNAKNDQG